MGYIKSEILEETGFVVLDPYKGEIDPKEWLDIEYVDWKSSGDTRFAPIASAKGEIECNGFWNHKPPRTDKDGVWIDSQVEIAPTLTARAKEPGVNVGRCRIIELQPNTYADCLYNLHQDDNNRLNPDGTGWVVRSFFQLTDDKDSFFVLRDNRTDPSVEYRLQLRAGTQLVIDTQRLWHAATHISNDPRYCLINSWESGPELDAYLAKYNATTEYEQFYVPAGRARRRPGRAGAPSRRPCRVLRGEGAEGEGGDERGVSASSSESALWSWWIRGLFCVAGVGTASGLRAWTSVRHSLARCARSRRTRCQRPDVHALRPYSEVQAMALVLPDVHVLRPSAETRLAWLHRRGGCGYGVRRLASGLAGGASAASDGGMSS